MGIAKIVLGASLALIAVVDGLAADPLKVTLLGTGTPTPRLSSFSAATLVEAGSEKLLFDVGRGSTIRLYQKQIPFGAITAHFITHLHSDHIVGLPDLWLTGWLAVPFGSRKAPMTIYGPRGTVAMTENLTNAFAEDIRIRKEDEHLSAEGVAFAAHDVSPGLVYQRGGVKVTAIEVNHGERIKPSFGYIVEFEGKKVVLSGDTKYDERIAEAARGADLLIHEVAAIEPGLSERYPAYREIEAHHTSPEEAGRIFSLAGPKLAVYSHIVFGTAKPVPDIPEDTLIARTRATYGGPLLVGRDLMTFTIDDAVRASNEKGEPIEPKAQ